MGKHHVPICKFDEKDDEGFGVVPHVYSNKTVLLQTAKAALFGFDNKRNCTTRILSDTGSQRCFITKNLRNHLKLKTVCTRKNNN